jgi:hypothetical protein
VLDGAVAAARPRIERGHLMKLSSKGARLVIVAATPNLIRQKGGRPTCELEPGQQIARRACSRLAVRGLAATVAAVALVAPAVAAAQPSLIAQAQAAMQRKDAVEEAYGAIPFKLGTKFTIACTVRGLFVACDEHAGPERCSNGSPWILLSDSFPIIGRTIGRPMSFALIVTSEYCGGQ